MQKQVNPSQFYIVDFVKKLAHKKNIWAILYLLINMAIITVFMRPFANSWWQSILYGVLLYTLTGVIALSPVGEWLFRLLNGCKKIKDSAVLNRLLPLFQEVKDRAQRERPDVIVDPKINIYIKNDDSINAFAMGRRTVCVTQGLLQLSDEQIKGVLGHEFGHLVTHDTDLTLLITVGNFMISAVVTVIRVILYIYHLIISFVAILVGGKGGLLLSLLNTVYSFLMTVLIDGAMWIWTQLGILMVMKSSRDAEYEADAFSADIGYRAGLLSFFQVLDQMETHSGAKANRGNIFAALASSHPPTDKRIDRLQNKTLPAGK